MAGALFAFVLLAACEQAAPPTDVVPVPVPERASQVASGPRIEFVSLAHAFGKVSDIATLNNSFAFRNVGDQQLVITGIKPSCGCTTTQLDQKIYEPGEGGLIESQWEVKGSGRQQKTITVSTNGKPERSTLSISAEVEPFVGFEPSYLAFGQVRLGQEAVLRARLVCADEKLQVLGIHSPNPHLVAQYVVDDDGQPAVLATLAPSAPWGMLTTSIAVDVSGRPGGQGEILQHRVELGVSASVYGDLSLSISLFGVGRVDPGASFRSVVELVHSDDLPFEITELRLADGAVPSTMSVRSEPLIGAGSSGYRLIVEGEAGGYLGLIRGQVSFRTDVVGEPERRLSVMGMVRALESHEH